MSFQQRLVRLPKAVRGYAVANMDGRLMRSLAWALLGLRSDELGTALEYAGQGQIHTAVSVRAIAREVEAGS